MPAISKTVVDKAFKATTEWGKKNGYTPPAKKVAPKKVKFTKTAMAAYGVINVNFGCHRKTVYDLVTALGHKMPPLEQLSERAGLKETLFSVGVRDAKFEEGVYVVMYKASYGRCSLHSPVEGAMRVSEPLQQSPSGRNHTCTGVLPDGNKVTWVPTRDVRPATRAEIATFLGKEAAAIAAQKKAARAIEKKKLADQKLIESATPKRKKSFITSAA